MYLDTVHGTHVVKVNDMLLCEINNAAFDQLVSEIESWGVSLDAEVEQIGRGIHISKIVVPKEVRGQGLGSKALKAICNFADENGMPISLTPSNDFGGNVKRLYQFYGKFGFVKNKGRNKDFIWRDAMYRRPKLNAMLNGPEALTPDRPDVRDLGTERNVI